MHRSRIFSADTPDTRPARWQLGSQQLGSYPRSAGLTELSASSSIGGNVSGYLASRYVITLTRAWPFSALTREIRSSASAS